ncbi:MAG: hypothetical protein ABIJ59_17790 [Pseudomonadota bacterium]
MSLKIIGYSGFDPYEDCYEYFENSCYIADTPKSAENLMKNSFSRVANYQIDPVTIEQVMDDFGCSCGDYAMEKEAFDKFKAIAEKDNIRFTAKKEDTDIPLMIVKVEGVNLSDD